jgi:hypothetical protein
VVEAVADSLEQHGRPTLVVDPVLVSTSGDTLAGKDCIEAILHRCGQHPCVNHTVVLLLSARFVVFWVVRWLFPHKV